MRRTALLGLLFLLVVFLAACSRGTVKEQPSLTTPVLNPSTATSLPQPESASPSSIPPLETPALNPTSPPAEAPTSPPVDAPTLPPPSPTPEMPAQPAAALDLPPAEAYAWQLVVDGLDKPIGLTNAGDGSGRLFILEQDGRLRILQQGGLLVEPFLDITERVGRSGSEQGLLGLAFHPQYAQNGLFYVNYTDLNGDTVIARFQVDGQDANRAQAGSEQPVLQIPQPYANHNGGHLAFGPDGYLYIGMGDGGSAGDPQENGQSLDTLLGKILRIDVDSGEPYAIPADNPFAAGGGRPEIWAYGLRNPWRFSFDRLTGDLYIADVGQNTWEEVNWLPAGEGGANFGWNIFEASHPFRDGMPDGAQMMMPVAEYNHNEGCSVTGGYAWRSTLLPAWQGVYLYGDYCTGFVWGLLRTQQGAWKNARLFEFSGTISSFGEDEQGQVYLVDHAGGVYLLVEK